MIIFQPPRIAFMSGYHDWEEGEGGTVHWQSSPMGKEENYEQVQFLPLVVGIPPLDMGKLGEKNQGPEREKERRLRTTWEEEENNSQ